MSENRSELQILRDELRNINADETITQEATIMFILEGIVKVVDYIKSFLPEETNVRKLDSASRPDRDT